jgi:hypothetical protein
MKKKRRGGWPARTYKPGERVPMSFRVTTAFKEKLDRAAQESGRSLAQEIEFRLERSLDQQSHLVDAFELAFDRQVAGLILTIGAVIKRVQPVTPGPRRALLSDDPEIFRVMTDSINLLLQAIDPAAHPRTWARLRKALSTDYLLRVEKTRELDRLPAPPELNAAMVASGLADPTGFDLGPLASTIRNWLGEAAIARLRDRLGISGARE